MANVRVAVRVRPLSKRETKEGGRIIVEVDDKVAKIRNVKVDSRPESFGDTREKVVAFGFDYCYWSVNPEDPRYASQEVVFQDLGTEVLSGAAKGYNICLFAYGQTGSGKTYTMLGTPASVGLTPRICEALFIRKDCCTSLPSSHSIKISFLEIYNERVRDLLKQSNHKSYTLRVREHPEMGPYVQGLSQHVVTNYQQVIQLLEEGIANRMTAATHVHEASSRSHAIFTIHYTKAVLQNNLFSETTSKINLVDLAGSEKADPSYCKDRITEGANINKSLVTLGIVISALAQNSQVFSSCQSLSSAASSGSDSGIPSTVSGASSGGGPARRPSYIPYRDSVLTWLLKESLGGNSKTIMVATVSPAHTSYSETMSTMRYASNAKNIINKPQVNEDANVKLIRELREEIGRLKAMLLSFKLRNLSSLNDELDESQKELVLQNDLKVGKLTQDWAQKWNDWQALTEHFGVDINRKRAGVVIDSSLPHLMALEDDVLSTGVVLYHLKEGTTKIGRIDSDQEQDIVLQGQWIERDHCTITSTCGVVILRPTQGARCTVNGREVTASCRLTQGAVITLGKAQKFRFNHPAEAELLRHQRLKVGKALGSSGSLEWLDLNGDVTALRLDLCPQPWKESAFLNSDPSTTPPPDPTHQVPEKTPSACTIPPPRTGRSGRNGFHPSGRRKLYPARGASPRREVSTQGACLTGSYMSVNSQDTEPLGKQPCQMSSQSSGTLCQSTKKLKHGSRTLTPAAHTRRDKGLGASVNTQTGWQKVGSYETYKALKETTTYSAYLSGSKQAAGHGKIVTAFQAESKPPPPSRAPKKHQRVLTARARDFAKKFSHLPCGSPLKKQLSAEDPDTLASFTGSRLIMDHLREKDNDLSDTESSYSVDSLSHVYIKVPKELLKPKDLQGKWVLPDPENSESDNSQISEDSLAENRYQSPPENLGGEYSTKDSGYSRTRTSASVRGFTMPSDRSLFTQAHGSFSLDSLIEAAELGDRQEEPYLGSADEGPTETFWHLQKDSLPAADQEATCRPSPIIHRTAVRLNVFVPKSNSFYLDPQFQHYCEQPESEMEASYFEQTNSFQGVQVTRASPLVSVDSWFSCDSKGYSSSPSGIIHSLCPSPDRHEIQLHGETPRHWLSMEEVKSPATVLSGSHTFTQASAMPTSSSDLCAPPASDTSKPSICGHQRLLQPGVDGVFQGRKISDVTYQAISEESHSPDISSVLAPSGTSVTHVGSIHEDWTALQQKYLLELSNSVLGAVGEPRPAFLFLEEDSSSLAEASDKVDTQLPVDPGVSRTLGFSYFPVHLSKARHVREEKNCGSVRANLESASDRFSAAERVSSSGVYPADPEPLTSESEAQAHTAGNKTPNPMTEAWEVNRASLEGSLQSGKNPRLITSSGQHFFQKRAYHNDDTLAAEVGHWPQDGARLRKNTAVQPGLLSQHPLLEEKATSPQSSGEAAGTHEGGACTLPSEPELLPHSAPWDPFPPSLQPPPLETFYVTKSRDALTETALEIPACREARVPSPPPREAWGFGHSYEVLQKVHWKNNLPKVSKSQNSKIDPSQQATTKRPTDLSKEEVTEELGDHSRNMKEEESHDSAYCFVAQNRHLPSASLKACKCGNHFGILNKKYSLSVHKEGEEACAWHHCSVAFDGSESKTLLFICDPMASEEEQDALLSQIHTCDVHSQTSSGGRSDFIGNINFDLDKIQEETAVSLESRSVHCRVSSPVFMARGGSPTHMWEGRNETVLLREVISKDIREEFNLPGTQYTCERCRLVLCSQKRKPVECKAHGQSQEIKSKEEPLGEQQNKRFNNAEEMARLLRSVIQLETGILEIESKQNKHLHASHMSSTEFMLQDIQDQERADHVLMPGSSGKHLFFGVQPSFPVQIEDDTRDSKSREEDGGSALSYNAQVQKVIGSPSRSREYAQVRQSESEHSDPQPGVDRLARDTCDSLGKGIALRESSNVSLHSRRMKELAGALPLQLSVERSEKDDELLKTSTNFQDQAWALESLEEPQTMEKFQENQIVELPSDSHLEDTKAHGSVEEMAVKRGENLHEEENMISPTQEFLILSQHCEGTFFSQETVSPSHSQTGFSAALLCGELSGTQPMHYPSLPRSCLHASGTKGISSFEHMLEPTMWKINRSSLATGVGHQDLSGETSSSSPQGSVAGDTYTTHAAWCGSVMPMVTRADGRSVTPDSILPEMEDWITVSTGPQGDQKGDFRDTSIGFLTQEGLDSEAEATVQKEIKTSYLDRVSRQTEKKVSFLLPEDSGQGEEERQKAEEKSEDQHPASSACLTPVSLLEAPNPEPLLPPDPSIHASICLAILKEIRQAKAQRKRLSDFVADRTVLPHCKPSQEAECFLEAAGRSQEQMVKLGWGSTRKEDEAQGLHAASPSAVSADLLADEASAEDLHHLPDPETDRGPRYHLLASSHTVPDLEKGHCTRETRQFGGASGWFGSSEVIEKKKETSRTLSPVYPLVPDRLLSTPTVEQDGRVRLEKVSVSPSQASCDDPGRSPHGQSQLASWEPAEGMSFGGQDRTPGLQEPRSLDSTCGGGSGKVSVTSQEGKAVHAECQTVICNADNAAGLLGPKQDRFHYTDASTGLEEVKASPKPCAVEPGAPTKFEADAHMWRPVKWKNVGSGLAEACGDDSKYTRSTPLLDQRPILSPSGVGEEAPGLSPKECLVSEGNTGGSRLRGSSYEEEEDGTIPYSQLSGSPPTVHAYSCHSSTLPCWRDGVLRKGTPCAAPLPVHSPFIVPSSETGGTVESFSKDSQVFSEHGLKHKHVNIGFGSGDISIPSSPTTPALPSPAQSSSSLCSSEVRANCFTHTVAGRRSVEGSGEKTSGKKASSAPEDDSPSSPAGTHSEPLRTLKDKSVGENAQVSQTMPGPPVVTRGLHTLNLNKGSVGGELVKAAQDGHLDNTIRPSSENTQPFTEVRGHSYLGPHAKFVDMLKHTNQSQTETSWEEEEQQRDEPPRGGKDHAQARNGVPSNKGGFDDSQTKDGEREEMAVTKSSVSQTYFSDFEDPASLPLGQTEPSQPVARTPGQLCSERDHLAPHHRHALPVIAIFSGPKNTRYSPRPQFSVVSSSRSLQELNLNMEPPSPTEKDAQEPNRLWGPHLRGHSSEKPVSTCPKTQDCSHKVSRNFNNSPTNDKPLKAVIPPYPTSSTVSCMPTPDFMTNWMPGTLEEARQGKTHKLSVQSMPENWHSRMDKEMHFGSSDISPYVLPWCPQRPVHIGWKQYVFGSTVDVSCSQKPQCLIPSTMAQCSSIDNALEDKKSLFHSHLRNYTQTRDLSNIHSGIESNQNSNKGWEIWSSSLAVGEPHVFTGSEGVAPIRGPDKRPPFKGHSEEIGYLRSELPLAGRSATAQVDDIVLLCPSERGHTVSQARMNTFEQGTQTLGSRLHWSCTNISAQPNATTMSASELASWTSMHNLSLHLSQLLHSTSELLGSLSQTSVVPKEQNIKSESPDEAPQAPTMDSCTQTTVDEGIQTDLASSPLLSQPPEVKPQEVIVEVMDSDIITVAQEKREGEEAAELPDLREGSTHNNLQSLPVSSPHLRFQKVHLGQNLTLVSFPASPDGSPSPSLQPEESCMVVNSPRVSQYSGIFHGASEFTQEPSTQKKPGLPSAVLVDRASSPILIFSASAQELNNPLASSTLSVPSAHSLEDSEKLGISPDVAVGDPGPPVDNSEATDESDVPQRPESLEREGKNLLERSSERLFLDSSSSCSQQKSSSLHVSFLEQAPQQLQSKSTTGDQSRLPSPPPRHRSLKLDDSFMPEKVASIEHGPLISRRPSQWQVRAASEDESSVSVAEPQPGMELSSSWRGLQPLSPCPISYTTGLQNPSIAPPQACNPVGLLCPDSHICVAPGLQHHSLRDLPIDNKFNNWYGVQIGPCGELHVGEDLEAGCDSSSVDQTQRPLQPSGNYSQDPEWPRLKHIPLQIGVQKPSLSVELTEAKLHHGFGETDALMKVLQSGTGDVLAHEEPSLSSREEYYSRQKKTTETLRNGRTEQLHNFRRTRSLTPQKQVSFLPSKYLPTWERDLPSRRREYLQQLRKDVVETTRIPQPASRPARFPSDIDLMLRDYHRAREKAKVEIAQARDRLRERTEQEKMRIRQQIISQLLKEEESLQTLATSSSLCTSSNGSISSGVTSGYNSIPAFSGHLHSLEAVEDSQVPESEDTWIGDWRGLSSTRNSHLCLTGHTWKSLAHSCRASLGSGCFSSCTLSNSGTCFSSQYQDLAKHIVNTSMADVMAACSDNLHNLFRRRATAGWNYQGEEQKVQLYYKEFSSTRHGFLGAGVVSQPLSQVWAAVSDPTLWPLYHKPIQTVRLHQRVTNSISLVYLVCDTTLCALKQLRDFCCVCVEAKEVPMLWGEHGHHEGHLSIMAAQSVYDTSMPRPSRKMVRGEILPSAWVLQPVITEGREITRVIFLAQVELGAPGFPPHLLHSFIKQQPLVVAKLASFLGS
ncbi:stAR-related lipid transfer protein 9 isoform X3 [Meriones unguiculatus]|uniref:stAR-related lipid transfer protein 9 isoform X3 n=1 Tax=Meriones unguiculatus TaxID=10047 RepID=UPI00293F677B|nr:stAR-related lipid transfer protein 9 isoform X3 [Meriones unguiculatus]